MSSKNYFLIISLQHITTICIQLDLKFFFSGIATDILRFTVKPAHVVTSIKQSPVLKSLIFIVLS